MASALIMTTLLSHCRHRMLSSSLSRTTPTWQDNFARWLVRWCKGPNEDIASRALLPHAWCWGLGQHFTSRGGERRRRLVVLFQLFACRTHLILRHTAHNKMAKFGRWSGLISNYMPGAEGVKRRCPVLP